MLARIKLAPQDIRRAILEIDDQRLSVDDLRAISRNTPTDDEIGRLRDFADVGKLAKADQYFNEVRMRRGERDERLTGCTTDNEHSPTRHAVGVYAISSSIRLRRCGD